MAHSLKILKFLHFKVHENLPGNCRVLVTFLPRYKVFLRNFHFLGKTGQVLFLNARKITTVIQKKEQGLKEG